MDIFLLPFLSNQRKFIKGRANLAENEATYNCLVRAIHQDWRLRFK